MLELISISTALVINFLIPQTSHYIDKNSYEQLGFPYQYYPGEVLIEVKVRCRRKHITCYTFIIWSVLASNLGVGYIQSETNGLQPRPEIHRVIHDLRGGVNSTEVVCLLITIWMLQ